MVSREESFLASSGALVFPGVYPNHSNLCLYLYLALFPVCLCPTLLLLSLIKTPESPAGTQDYSSSVWAHRRKGNRDSEDGGGGK